MRALFPPHRAAIFDLDGTLLDSMWVWHAVDRDFFAARNMLLPDDYAHAIQALTFRETAEYTVKRFHLPQSPEEVMSVWNELSFCQYRDHVKLKPGAREYLEALHAQGILLGVATNLALHTAQTALEQNGVLHYFKALTSADEVARGKNFPDIYLLAAQKLEVNPRLCVAYDDVARSLLGMRAAGMTACAVRETGFYQDWDEMTRTFDYSLECFQ